jgi:hypothetical protein
MWDSIRNRNLAFEQLTSDKLPIKYDMLTGRPIKEYDFMTRLFNVFSPVQLNLDQSPGRKFLFDSGYDLRLSTYFSPNGDNLQDSPIIRSMYQKAIGDQNLEHKLNKLAVNERIQSSIDQMNADIRGGKRGDFETSDYYHNRKIDAIFQEARRKAWASIMRDPRIQLIIKEQKEAKRQRYKKQQSTTGLLVPYR